MKMPEKNDLLAAILAAKEQGIGAILAFAMAYLRGRYNGGAFTKTVIDATMCAIIAWFIRVLIAYVISELHFRTVKEELQIKGKTLIRLKTADQV